MKKNRAPSKIWLARSTDPLAKRGHVWTAPHDLIGIDGPAPLGERVTIQLDRGQARALAIQILVCLSATKKRNLVRPKDQTWVNGARVQ